MLPRFRWKLDLAIPTLDMAGLKAAFRGSLMDAIGYIAFEWLNATVQDIPVWSGASRATFLHLARQIGYQVSTSPVAGAPDRRSLGVGQSSGGFDTKDIDAGRVLFNYETQLKHLVFNEYNNANLYGFKLHNPGPYRFQDKGQAAFHRAAKNISLPNPFDHIKITRRKVR